MTPRKGPPKKETAPRLGPPTKDCAQCGKTMVRENYGRSEWVLRKFCSHPCSLQHKASGWNSMQSTKEKPPARDWRRFGDHN